MKTILEFNLPDDKEELQLALNGVSYYIALSDIQDLLRTKMKHGDLTDTEYKVYESLREKFYEILNDREITI